MKQSNYILLSLALIAAFGGLTIWNYTATRASAQKSDESFDVVTGAVGEYNARDEFALVQGGTTGVWNYGYTSGPASDVFIPYPNTNSFAACSASPGTAFLEWRDNALGGLPELGVNASGAPFFCGGLRAPTDAVYMHPGFNNERSVLRWTAPASGTYRVSGVFEGLDAPGSRDVGILKNAGGAPLLNELVNGQGQQPFNFTIALSAGDTIGFYVGSNGSYNFDGTALAVVIGAPVTACATAPANLQVNVPAENSPVDVQSVNPNASLVGDAAYTNSGKVGRAFDFDGNGDYAFVEDNAAQRPANAVTVEGWFKFDTAPGLVSLISKPLRGSSLNSYTLYLDGGQLRGLVSNGPQYTRAFSQFTPQTGVWHHLAFTYDYTGGVSTLKLYANGVDMTTGQDGTANILPAYDANPFPLLIGGEFENNAPAFTLDGQADEVSVYGRALSQSEIFDIVRQGSFGKCAPGSACVAAPQSLISFYKGEDNALDSNSLNPGTLVNGTTFQSAKVGRGFKFDGVDDAVSIPDSPSLKPQNLTLETWVKFDSLTSTVTGGAPSGYQNIIFKKNSRAAGSGFEGGYSLVKNPSNVIGIGFNSPGGAENFANSTTVVQAGVWYHIVATHDGTNIKLYVNGQLEGTGAATFPIDYGTTPLYFGTSQVPFSGYFNGVLDEVSIYNRAITAAEVTTVFNAGANGKCLSYVCAQSPNDLVSWFAGEQNALDAKSNNHGTLQNGATFANGRVGQAFSFDGVDDKVSVPNTPSLDITGNQLTIEAWINPASVAGDRQIVSMASSAAQPAGRKFGLYVQNGGLGFEVNTTGGYGGPPVTGAVAANVWTHVAGVYNGSQMIWYINGSPVGSAGLSGNIVSSGGGFAVGQFAAVSASSFQGLIDEVAIYDRALSQSELQSIVSAGSSGKCKPVAADPPANQVAWFAGDGDARDFTGLNSTGTLQGNTNYRVGKVGQSFGFDGSDDYISTADSANWDFGTGDFAVEAWFNAPNPTGVQRIISAGSQADGANNLWSLGYGDIGAWGGGQRLNFAVYNGGSYSDFSSNPVVFRPNTWHHAAVVRSGTTFTFYLDGAAVGTAAVGAGFAIDGGTTGAIVGARYNQNPGAIFEFASGKLDEIAIYKRGLTGSEIAAIYNAGSAGKSKSVATPVNFSRKAKTAANLAPTAVQLASATVTFAQVAAAGTTTQSGLDLGLLPPLPSGATFTGLAYDISTTAGYQNGAPDDVQVCFNVPALAGPNFANLRILHLENGVWQNRTAAGGASPNLCTDNLASLSPFAIVQALAPTAANVSVAGRVADAGGRGINGVTVTLTDSQGRAVTTRTNNFGRYVFGGVPAGGVYFVGVSSKRYSFAVSAQAVELEAAVENVDFTASEGAFARD